MQMSVQSEIIPCCHSCYRISEKKFYVGLNEALLNQTEKVQLCSRCHLVYYCDKKCQKKDWSKHKEICLPITRTRCPQENKNGRSQNKIFKERVNNLFLEKDMPLGGADLQVNYGSNKLTFLSAYNSPHYIIRIELCFKNKLHPLCTYLVGKEITSFRNLTKMAEKILPPLLDIVVKPLSRLDIAFQTTYINYALSIEIMQSAGKTEKLHFLKLALPRLSSILNQEGDIEHIVKAFTNIGLTRAEIYPRIVEFYLKNNKYSEALSVIIKVLEEETVEMADDLLTAALKKLFELDREKEKIEEIFSLLSFERKEALSQLI